MLHRAGAYIAMAIALPVLFAALSQASRFRWAATVTSAVYIFFVIAEILILPLFPAQPKLGGLLRVALRPGQVSRSRHRARLRARSSLAAHAQLEDPADCHRLRHRLRRGPVRGGVALRQVPPLEGQRELLLRYDLLRLRLPRHRLRPHRQWFTRLPASRSVARTRARRRLRHDLHGSASPSAAGCEASNSESRPLPSPPPCHPERRSRLCFSGGAWGFSPTNRDRRIGASPGLSPEPSYSSPSSFSPHHPRPHRQQGHHRAKSPPAPTSSSSPSAPRSSSPASPPSRSAPPARPSAQSSSRPSPSPAGHKPPAHRRRDEAFARRPRLLHRLPSGSWPPALAGQAHGKRHCRHVYRRRPRSRHAHLRPHHAAVARHHPRDPRPAARPRHGRHRRRRRPRVAPHPRAGAHHPRHRRRTCGSPPASRSPS